MFIVGDGRRPYYVKTRVLSGLGDGLVCAEVCHDALVDLSRKEAFKASDDLAFGPAIGGASGDVVAGWLVESHADDDGSISTKIKISFLRCLGPRCSRRRTCGRTGQQRNDLDARRCRECGGIETNGSACAVRQPRPERVVARPASLRVMCRQPLLITNQLLSRWSAFNHVERHTITHMLSVFYL